MKASVLSARGRAGAYARRRAWPFILIVLPVALLLGCEADDDSEPAQASVRPVRVGTAEKLPGGETVTLTGTVQAQEDVNLAFRIGGQLIERSVNVGDQVKTGQVVARLDPSTRRDALDGARANLAAAMARLVEARNTVERYEPLLPQGFVARAQFDRAVEARDAAQAQVDAAQAQVTSAETQLSYTELRADGPGTVTARGAEPGEVVSAGQMILRLAREGGRDAVFDVPARVKDAASSDLDVEVVLSTDPKVRATGRIREVSPQADPVTRTFLVRVGLTDPPQTMRLGSTVTGAARLGGIPGIAIPASALTAANGAPAVWVLDPDEGKVTLRNIEVARYELDRVLVERGLDEGELVVTAGVQALRPGQRVRLLGSAGTARDSGPGATP